MRHVYFTAVVIGLVILINGCQKVDDTSKSDTDFISITGKPLSVECSRGKNRASMGIVILKDDKPLLCVVERTNFRISEVSLAALIEAEIADNDDEAIKIIGEMVSNSRYKSECIIVREVIVGNYSFSF